MYLTTYIFSIIFSIGLKLINQAYNLKKLANDGYKYEKTKFISKKFIILLVPIVNIIFALKKTKSNNKNIKLSEKELFQIKNIIPLTKTEQEIYSKKPTLLNALKLNLKNNSTPNMVLLYMKDGIENIIYINQKQELNIIISTEGPISTLSKKDQYKQLEEQLKEINFSI